LIFKAAPLVVMFTGVAAGRYWRLTVPTVFVLNNWVTWAELRAEP